MKKCNICCIEKPFSQFSKTPYGDGYRGGCKECRNKQRKIRYEKLDCDPDTNLKEKRCYSCKKTKEIEDFYTCRKFKDGYSNICIFCTKNKSNALYKVNTETIKKATLQYYYNNKDKVRESRRKRQKERMEEDPIYKLKRRLKIRVTNVIRKKGLTKSHTYKEYLGCTDEFFYSYIENQFQDGMSWDNHGIIWDLDHIFPISAADTEKRVYELSHYKNLRPMYCKENKNKANKRVICWQKIKRDIHLDSDIKENNPIGIKASQFDLNQEQFSPEHRVFIEKYEWLGTVGFGVRWVFTARYQGKLAGVVMLSEPNMYEFGEKEALIQRGACSSWAPKNLNSRLVMFACRWMVQNTNKRIFTAYSDPEAGEIGTIYQACNFDYLGQTYGAKYNYILPTGELVNERYFTRTASIKKWAKELGIKWEENWSKSNGFQDVEAIPKEVKDRINSLIVQKKALCTIIDKEPKGKYVLLLNYGKNKIKKTWTPLPYPKRKL